MHTITLSSVSLFFVATFLNSSSFSQTLNLNETVDYINDKLVQNPYEQVDGYGKLMNTQYFSISLSNNGLLTVTQKTVASYGTEVCKYQIYKDDIDPSFKYAKDNKQNLPISDELNITCQCANDYTNFNNQCNCVKCYRDDANSTIDVGCFCVGSSIAITYSNKNSIGPSIFNAFQHLAQLMISSEANSSSADPNDPFSNANIYKNNPLNSGSSNNIIRLTKNQDGTLSVPVLINGVLKLDFILDSGASDVSISPDIALTLIKTGTISQGDFIGSETYQFANGSVAKSKVFILHKIEIGNKSIENVRASISNSVKSPILLGQSVLNRFGKVIIDYENSDLIIMDK